MAAILLVMKPQIGTRAMPKMLIVGITNPTHCRPIIKSQACVKIPAEVANFFPTVKRSKAADMRSCLAKLAMITVDTSDTVTQESVTKTTEDTAQSGYWAPVTKRGPPAVA